MGEGAMNFEEQLREIRAELARQDEEWERLHSALETLGDREVVSIARQVLDELTSAPAPRGSSSSEPFPSIRA
jgi:hypothetical protein